MAERRRSFSRCVASSTPPASSVAARASHSRKRLASARMRWAAGASALAGAAGAGAADPPGATREGSTAATGLIRPVAGKTSLGAPRETAAAKGFGVAAAAGSGKAAAEASLRLTEATRPCLECDEDDTSAAGGASARAAAGDATAERRNGAAAESKAVGASRLLLRTRFADAGAAATAPDKLESTPGSALTVWGAPTDKIEGSAFTARSAATADAGPRSVTFSTCSTRLCVGGANFVSPCLASFAKRALRAFRSAAVLVSMAMAQNGLNKTRKSTRTASRLGGESAQAARKGKAVVPLVYYCAVSSSCSRVLPKGCKQHASCSRGVDSPSTLSPKLWP